MAYQRQEQEKEFLAKMKHVSGDFNRWITRFEDQMETCDTVGVPLSVVGRGEDPLFRGQFERYHLRRDQGELHELEHEAAVP